MNPMTLFCRMVLLAWCVSAIPSLGVPDDGCGPALEDLTSEHHYEWAEGRFFASAEVMPNETGYAGPVVPGQRSLDMNFQLKDASGRSETLRGKEQFANAIRHFEGQFDQILAHFSQPHEGELSDNLEQFNRFTAAGKTPEQAAKLVWAGERSHENGYTEASIKTLEGTPGAYTKVVIRYRKPAQ